MDTSLAVKGKRILLVDDDLTVRESIKLLLSIDRHEVAEAANGCEALHHFTGGQFDLVIIDYFMPDMLGDELARNIKHLAPSQPILMLTAYQEKLVDQAETADAVLGKPVSLDSLREVLVRLAR